MEAPCEEIRKHDTFNFLFIKDSSLFQAVSSVICKAGQVGLC